MDNRPSFYRVPLPEEGPKKSGDMVVKGVDPLGSCCVVESIRWNPLAADHTTKCPACNNVLKAAEGESNFLEVAKDEDTGEESTRISKDYMCQMLAYDRKLWAPFRAEDDVEVRGLSKDGYETLHDLEVFVQRPVSWFYPDSIRTLKLEKGCIGVYGKIQEPFAEKAPSKEDLQVYSREALGIRRV